MFSTIPSILSFSNILAWSLWLSAAQAARDSRITDRPTDRAINLRTHSLYAPYIDQDLQNRWWDFGADSYINTNKHVRLTRNKPSQMGWLWTRLPLTVPNFIVETEFKISGHSTHLFGDGLAFWLTTERVSPGPIFGNKNQFNGFGLIVDTYANARHAYSFPRISGFLFDGSVTYDFGNDGDGQAAGACTANVRRTNMATKLKVTYIKGEYLDVKVQYKAWDEWSDCFRLENVTLPTNPFIGLTAMTGDVSDAHDIISVSTSSVHFSQTNPQSGKGRKSGRVPSASGEESGSWFGFFFKLIIFVGLVGGGIYGYQHYQRRKRYSGFRTGNFGGRTSAFGGDAGGMLGLNGPYANGKRF